MNTGNVVKISTKLVKGDEVVVIAGKEKGKKGKLLKIDFKSGKVYVDGVNMVKKHVKPAKGQQGEIITVQRPVNISNVALFCQQTQKATRIRIEGAGKDKKRISVKSGKEILVADNIKK